PPYPPGFLPPSWKNTVPEDLSAASSSPPASPSPFPSMSRQHPDPSFLTASETPAKQKLSAVPRKSGSSAAPASGPGPPEASARKAPAPPAGTTLQGFLPACSGYSPDFSPPHPSDTASMRSLPVPPSWKSHKFPDTSQAIPPATDSWTRNQTDSGSGPRSPHLF